MGSDQDQAAPPSASAKKLWRVTVTVEFDLAVVTAPDGTDGDACLLAKEHWEEEMDVIGSLEPEFFAKPMIQPDPEFNGCTPIGADPLDQREVNDYVVDKDGA
jgi:hypothetical protein